MNPTPSNLSTNRAPPSTGYLAGVLPHSGQTATSIATRGARKIRKWAVEVGNVVRAHVYMDSIFFAADAQCRLVNPDNLADERSLYEHDILVCLGERPEPKIRPCVVVGVVKEADEKPHYLLCPMATFSHQSYNKLEAPASLLVRPVETTYHNEPFGAYTPYRFDPEWDKGPQYLFPIQVSRTNDYITDHWLKQTIKNGSLEQLRKDIEEVSNVWKKWRHAEHVDVVSDADLPLFKSDWGRQNGNDLSTTQWKAYPLNQGGGTMTYLKLTTNTQFTQKIPADDLFNEPSDHSTLSNTSGEGRSPLAELEALLVQDDHPPWRTLTPPFREDFLASNSSWALYDSKEIPDSHPAAPSHSVPAPTPRVTSFTEKDITHTEITLQSPHGEAAGAIGDAPPKLEGSSDMDISSTSNGGSSHLKNVAEHGSFRSPRRSNSPSLVRKDPITPGSSQHLLKDTVSTLHRIPNFLPSSDRIPVDAHIPSEVSQVDLDLDILDGDASVSPWKKTPVVKKTPMVKRARSSEDEPPAANRAPKRPRITYD